MKRLILAACLFAALLALTPSQASADRYGYYNSRVSNVWHPRSSAYLSRPTYRLQPQSYSRQHNFGYYARPSYNYYQTRPSFQYNARPSFQYNARPSFQYNARPSFRYNARPRF